MSNKGALADVDPFTILERRLGGETLQSIGDDLGVTRERIRQVCTATYNSLGYTGSVGRALVRERRQERVFAEFAARAARAFPCAVCGCWVLRNAHGAGKSRTCSHSCAVAWGIARYQLDDEERRKMQFRIARWHVAHPSEVNPSTLRFSKRVLNGEVSLRRRWVIPGSKAAALVAAVGLERHVTSGAYRRAS